MARDDASSFLQAWRRFYPGEHPDATILLRHGVRHWVRFHSLPQSKRYAENECEQLIILRRQNVLADQVLGSQPCWLVQTHYLTSQPGTDFTSGQDWFAVTRDWGLQPIHTFADVDEDDEPPRIWRTYAGLTSWLAGKFDDWLLRIADDMEAPTLWMSATSGAIFAPYDGGVDIFTTEEQRDVLRRTFQSWLSSHPEGL